MTRQVRGSAGRLPGYGANAANDIQGGYLIRCLEIPRSVDLSPSASKRDRVPAKPLHQPIQLPAASYRVQDAVLRPTLSFTKRQRVRTVDCQVVRPVIAGERFVSTLN